MTSRIWSLTRPSVRGERWGLLLSIWRVNLHCKWWGVCALRCWWGQPPAQITQGFVTLVPRAAGQRADGHSGGLGSAQPGWGREWRKAGQTLVLFVLLIGLIVKISRCQRSGDIYSPLSLHHGHLCQQCILSSAKSWTVSFTEVTGQWSPMWRPVVTSFHILTMIAHNTHTELSPIGISPAFLCLLQCYGILLKLNAREQLTTLPFLDCRKSINRCI